MDQQTLIYIGVGLFALAMLAGLGIGIYMLVRRVGRRKFGGQKPMQMGVPPKQTSGCNCEHPEPPGCVPAVQCTPPYAPPVAINGLSCDPTNTQFAFAGDIQIVADAMNRQSEAERTAASMQRLKDAMAYIEAQAKKS